MDGAECNKVGVGYQAFQNQANKCDSAAGSCNQGQIKHLMEDDLRRKADNKAPLYMLSRYGNFKSTRDAAGLARLNLQYTADMATSLLITIDASDLTYTVNTGKGLITAFLIKDFEGLATYGLLNLTVQSLSSLASAFELSLNCSADIKMISSQTFSLLPKEVKNLTFNVYTETQLRANHSCQALLLNAVGTEVHTLQIDFSTTETNFTAPQFESANYTGVIQTQHRVNNAGCEEVCTNTANVFCMIMNVPAKSSRGAHYFPRMYS